MSIQECIRNGHILFVMDTYYDHELKSPTVSQMIYDDCQQLDCSKKVILNFSPGLSHPVFLQIFFFLTFLGFSD